MLTRCLCKMDSKCKIFLHEDLNLQSLGICLYIHFTFTFLNIKVELNVYIILYAFDHDINQYNTYFQDQVCWVCSVFICFTHFLFWRDSSLIINDGLIIILSWSFNKTKLTLVQSYRENNSLKEREKHSGRRR